MQEVKPNDEQGEANQVPWSCLPAELLVQVLSTLRESDLRNAHLVSRSWRQTTLLGARCLTVTAQGCPSLDDVGRLLGRFQGCSSLTLRGFTLGPGAGEHFARWTQLASLKLDMCYTDASLFHPDPPSSTSGAPCASSKSPPPPSPRDCMLPRLRELAVLDTRDGAYRGEQGALQQLLGGPLTGMGMAGAATAAPSLRFLPSLECLSLEGRACPLHPLPPLPHLSALTRLTRLHIASRRRAVGVPLAGLEGLGSLIRLRELELAGSLMDEQAVRSLAALTGLRSLVLQDEVIFRTARLRSLTGLSGLTRLDVSLGGDLPDRWRVRITDDALQALPSFPQLRRLNLAGNWSLTDAALAAGLAGLRQLEELDVGGTGFGCESAVVVAELPHLRRLDVRGCRRATKGTLEMLAGLLPSCAIQSLPQKAGSSHLSCAALLESNRCLWLCKA